MSFATTVNADAVIKKITLKSDIFENERTLRVYLPNGYDKERDEPYPVLYMNDGQNIFSADTSMTSREWQMDETLSSFILSGDLEPMIVVGIDTPSYADRGNEYLPWPDEYLKPFIEKPNGKSYPDFLQNEVIPMIESRFNVGTEAKYRSLGGASYGGLITLYTALQTENIFANYLIESPSFYVNKNAISKLARRNDLVAGKIYIGIGTHEGLSSCDQAPNEDAVDDMRRVVEQLNGDFELLDVVEECGFHSEIDWARRLPSALINLFGK